MAHKPSLARRTEERRLNKIREAVASVVGEEDAAHLWDYYLIESGDCNAEVPTAEEALAGKLDEERAARLRTRGLWVHGPKHGDAMWLEPTEPKKPDRHIHDRAAGDFPELR